jgi:hypothetical protein
MERPSTNEPQPPLGPSPTGDLRNATDGLAGEDRRGRLVFHFLPFDPARSQQVRNFAAAMLLALVGCAALWFRANRWPGWIELTSNGRPLMVQILPGEGDTPLGEPFTVTTRSAVALPAGDYRLRVHGVGLLGRTYRFAVNQGETQTHALSLDEGRLLGGEPVQQIGFDQKPREEPLPFAPFTTAIELTAGKADVIEWTRHTVLRRDGQTGKAVWDALRLSPPWKNDQASADRLLGWLESGMLPELLQPAPDIDGDGTGDLVWFSNNMSSLLALSGANGRVLGEYALELDDPAASPSDDPRLPGPLRPAHRPVSLIDSPAIADLDGDGAADLVATLIFFEFPFEIERRSPSPAQVQGRMGRNPQPLSRRVIQAISGRTGRTLWSHPVDATFTTPSYPWNQAAVVLPGRKPTMLAYVDGEHWIGLDPTTGKTCAGPIDLGFMPYRATQYADFDGDGDLDILATGPGQSSNQAALAAFSVRTGRNLWIAAVELKNDYLVDATSAPGWPLVVDLEGDGRPELVVPHSGPMPPTDGFRGVRAIDGQSGQTRWTRPMRPENNGQDGLLQILDAPDLDHDGVRDLITTSFFLGRSLTSNHNGTPPIPERIFVDALSGKDGRPLWWWHQDNGTDRTVLIRKLRWWGRGPDGWPLLAVGLGLAGSDVPALVHNLEASTGRVASTVVGLSKAAVADLDGDGLADLWGEADGQLRAFRGESPEVWRALDRFGGAHDRSRWASDVVQPGGDFDGDAIVDTLIGGARTSTRSPVDSIASHAMGPYPDQGFPQSNSSAVLQPGSRTIEARSGRDGHSIWKTEVDPPLVWYEQDHGDYFSPTAEPLPDGDLDSDGTPDVVVQKFAGTPGARELKRAATLPLQALSGRTGRRLWSTGPLPLGFEAYGYATIHWAQARRIDPHSAPDVFVRHGNPFIPSRPMTNQGAPTRPWLSRVSGRDGRILWSIALSDEQDNPNNINYAPAPGFADLDGDGALDVVLVLPGGAGSGRPDHELRAISLRDGSQLWSLRLDFKNAFNNPPELAVADLDGDGQPEVVVTELPAAGEHQGFVLKVLEGRDGTVRWTWNGEAPTGRTDQPAYGWLTLAHLRDDARRMACLRFVDPKRRQRIFVFDERGHERARRELPENTSHVGAADVDGDGRDELLINYDNHLQVWTVELQNLWSRSGKAIARGQIQFIPPSAGRPGTVVVPEIVGLDGSDGRPRWTSHSPQMRWSSVFTASLLDPGDSARLPSFLTTGLGASVCRSVLPTTPTGALAPPRGLPVQPGLDRFDPRWMRPLPWAQLIDNDDLGSCLLVVIVLALFNGFLPFLILFLAARRRPWTMRLMLALPLAAAVPLTAVVVFEPLIPALPAPFPSSSRLLFALGSLAGIPIVSLAAAIGFCLVRRRWKQLALFAGLTVLASVVIGLAWLRFDWRSMPTVEHYTWSGWYLAVVPGAYAVGVSIVVGGAIRAVSRMPGRPERETLVTQ